MYLAGKDVSRQRAASPLEDIIHMLYNISKCVHIIKSMIQNSPYGQFRSSPQGGTKGKLMIVKKQILQSHKQKNIQLQCFIDHFVFPLWILNKLWH